MGVVAVGVVDGRVEVGRGAVAGLGVGVPNILDDDAAPRKLLVPKPLPLELDVAAPVVDCGAMDCD